MIPSGHEQVERSIDTAIRDPDGQRLLAAAQGAEIGDGPVQPRQPQKARHHASGLSRRHRAGTDGASMLTSLNSTLTERQNWKAASEKTGGRPRRPSCGASQAISLSTQISIEPRLRNAAS